MGYKVKIFQSYYKTPPSSGVSGVPVGTGIEEQIQKWLNEKGETIDILFITQSQSQIGYTINAEQKQSGSIIISIFYVEVKE